MLFRYGDGRHRNCTELLWRALQEIFLLRDTSQYGVPASDLQAEWLPYPRGLTLETATHVSETPRYVPQKTGRLRRLVQAISRT
jgi:hypothetical protein